MSDTTTPTTAGVPLWGHDPSGLLILIQRFPDRNALWEWLHANEAESLNWVGYVIGDDDVPELRSKLPFSVRAITAIIMRHKVLVAAHASVYRATANATDFAGSIGDRSPAVTELARKRAKAARLLVASFDSLSVAAAMAGSAEPHSFALIHNRPLLPLVAKARVEAKESDEWPNEPTAVTLACAFLRGVAESTNGEFPQLNG
jgi:hypothetical protein